MKASVEQVLLHGRVIGVNISIRIEELDEEADLQYLIGDVTTNGTLLINSSPSGLLPITAEMVN